ncbi:MAG: zinc-binding dehydrogenase, partial [Pseudomonadota bacterium]
QAGVDVIYDCVGGDHAEAAVRASAWNGRFLIVGFASGDIPKLPLNLLLLKGCGALGVFWGRSVDKDPQGYRHNMSQLMQWVAEGKLNPRIGTTLQMDKAAEGIRMLDNRTATGKIVLIP